MCARALVCVSVRARSTKLCAKLRVAPRSPPEAELRLSSLFSGSVFQLREERDGESICLFRGSSNSAAHGERVQNTEQHKDPSHTHTHRQHLGFRVSLAKHWGRFAQYNSFLPLCLHGALVFVISLEVQNAGDVTMIYGILVDADP